MNLDTPTSTLVSGLNHVAIVTADLERLCDFYRAVFGADVIEAPAPAGTRVAVVKMSATAGLNIVEAPAAPYTFGLPAMLERGHIDHVAFETPTAAALELVRRRLVERGASDGAVHDYGALLCVPFVDPDGMASEACWVRDPSFAVLHDPQPFTGALADLVRDPEGSRP